jgi:hypothetical protein
MDSPSHDWKEAEALLNSLYNADTSMIMVEVALASATSAPLNYGRYIIINKIAAFLYSLSLLLKFSPNINIP